MSLRGVALGIAGVVGIVTAPGVSAHELTELVGPYASERDAGPLAFRGGAELRWQRRTLAILREYGCIAHEAGSACPDGSRLGLARDLAATRTTTALDIDLRLAFYRALEVRLKLPFVIADETRLGFDAGVDEKSSLSAPYNAPALFEVPTVSERAGLGDPVVGLWVALTAHARDPEDPDLLAGVDVTFPLAPARSPGSDAVGSGAWGIALALAGSARALPWLEPFFRLDVAFAVPAGDEGLYADLGARQATRGPPERVGARFGIELVPYEHDRSAVRLELGGELALLTAGKSATELFDALGTSPCSADPTCELTRQAVGTRASGATIEEEHLATTLWFAARWDIAQSLRLATRATLGWETPHFLTASNLGVDVDGGGVDDVNRLGNNEHDPDYNVHLDAPGTRLRASEVMVVGLELSLLGRF